MIRDAPDVDSIVANLRKRFDDTVAMEHQNDDDQLLKMQQKMYLACISVHLLIIM